MSSFQDEQDSYEHKYIQERFDKEFDSIMEQIKGGKIYGRVIDMYDIKALVVSAYMLGTMAQSKFVNNYVDNLVSEKYGNKE